MITFFGWLIIWWWAQDTICPFICQGTLLTPIEPAVDLHSDSSPDFVSYPLRKSTAPTSLVSPENLLMVHSAPTARHLIKISNKTGSRMESLGTPLVTTHLSDVFPLLVTLRALLFSQFFTQHTVNLIHPIIGEMIQKDAVRATI